MLLKVGDFLLLFHRTQPLLPLLTIPSLLLSAFPPHPFTGTEEFGAKYHIYAQPMLPAAPFQLHYVIAFWCCRA